LQLDETLQVDETQAGALSAARQSLKEITKWIESPENTS
jgi:hypothetical protein